MIVCRLRRAAAALAAVATVAACNSARDPDPASTNPAPQSARAVVATTPSPAPTTSTPPAPPNPCAKNTAAQLVKVSVRQQHLWMCAGRTLVRDTPVTTGIPGEDTHTPTGTYTIQARTRNTALTLISGQTYAVKYWIPFDGPLFGFHDSSWQTIPYGSQRYRSDGSHGCVHVPVKAIAFLYRWAHVGATVRIRA
ncbi:L,D-transpeptidase [uncultured Jatrophihabitans sp.]|uniref:L,D-transpeptidase n=1 Tax=uncultured Jatrophihabitans sp. TaxID=1610747 RepID=UPI0035CAF1AE